MFSNLHIPGPDPVRTPTLYEVCEAYGYDFQEQLGAGTYPIWDETKREWLNTQIYNNFAYREVASESPTQFFNFIRVRMNRIMPKVNPIAALALGELEGVDWQVTSTSELVTTSDGTSTGKEDGTSSNTGTSETTGNGTGKVTVTHDTTTTTTGHETSSGNVGVDNDQTTMSASTSENKASALTSNTPQVQLSGNKNYMGGLNETGATGSTTNSETVTGGSTTTSSAEGNTTGETYVSGGDTTNTTTSDTSKTDSTGSGTTSSTSSGTTHNDGTSKSTNVGGQLSVLAEQWLNTSPDVLGVVFEALEPCFVQYWDDVEGW